MQHIRETAFGLVHALGGALPLLLSARFGLFGKTKYHINSTIFKPGNVVNMQITSKVFLNILELKVTEKHETIQIYKETYMFSCRPFQLFLQGKNVSLEEILEHSKSPQQSTVVSPTTVTPTIPLELLYCPNAARPYDSPVVIPFSKDVEENIRNNQELQASNFTSYCIFAWKECQESYSYRSCLERNKIYFIRANLTMLTVINPHISDESFAVFRVVDSIKSKLKTND